MRRLVETAHRDVTALLDGHRDQLESLARALLDAETLDAPDAYAAAGVAVPPREEPAGKPAPAIA